MLIFLFVYSALSCPLANENDCLSLLASCRSVDVNSYYDHTLAACAPLNTVEGCLEYDWYIGECVSLPNTGNGDHLDFEEDDEQVLSQNVVQDCGENGDWDAQYAKCICDDGWYSFYDEGAQEFHYCATQTPKDDNLVVPNNPTAPNVQMLLYSLMAAVIVGSVCALCTTCGPLVWKGFCRLRGK